MKIALALAAATVLWIQPASAAVTVGQANDFEDGTTQGWQTNLLGFGGAPQPTLQSGGPDGADDEYLVISSTGGGGPGSRLNIINVTGWAGDYLTSGVAGFSAQVINLGETDLYLRILFEDPGAMSPPLNIAYSSDPFFLKSGGGWTSAFFSALPDDLTAGVGDVDTVLANTTAIRLYHSLEDAFPGPPAGISPVVGSLGLDDFQATAAIPEPSTWAMMLLGFGAIGAVARRSRKAKAAVSYS